MNYRHIYHAGNFADCLKHTVFSRIIEYMQRKDKASSIPMQDLAHIIYHHLKRRKLANGKMASVDC
jgi:23S rRNA A2030 N6-methylase RlmJ